MPIIARAASGPYRPPVSRAYSARTSSHTCSESTITPSRSKTTASIKPGCNPGGRRRARSAPAPLRPSRSSPTKSVWSPVRISSTVRAVSQPDGAHEQARIVLAHLDPVPERDRRHAAGEMLREVLLLAGEHRRRPLPRVAEQLVQRRVERDRDADESAAASESETSDETVSPARRPSTSATTTETPAGQRRKSARCSAPTLRHTGEPRGSRRSSLRGTDDRRAA